MCLTDGLADAGHGQHGCSAAAPGLTVRDVFRDGRHTLTLCGEFDLRSRPVFDEALAQVGRGRPSILTLDLSGVAFMDSTGLHGVLAAKAICVEIGCKLVVVRGSEQVQHLFALTGVLEELQFSDQVA